MFEFITSRRCTANGCCHDAPQFLHNLPILLPPSRHPFSSMVKIVAAWPSFDFVVDLLRDNHGGRTLLFRLIDFVTKQTYHELGDGLTFDRYIIGWTTCMEEKYESERHL